MGYSDEASAAEEEGEPGKTTRVVSAGLLTGFAVGLWGCFFLLVQRWAHAAPQVPERHLGLIYPHNEHGWVTYFSAFQTTASFLLFAFSPVLFITGFGLVPKKNVRTRKGFLSWGMRFDTDDPRSLLVPCQLAGLVLGPVAAVVIGQPFVNWLVAQGVVIPFG